MGQQAAGGPDIAPIANGRADEARVGRRLDLRDCYQRATEGFHETAANIVEAFLAHRRPLLRWELVLEEIHRMQDARHEAEYEMHRHRCLVLEVGLVAHVPALSARLSASIKRTENFKD